MEELDEKIKRTAIIIKEVGFPFNIWIISTNSHMCGFGIGFFLSKYILSKSYCV